MIVQSHHEIIEFVRGRLSSPDLFETRKNDAEVWTSFERIEVALAAEEAFDIQFETEDLNAMRSPSDVVEAIAKALRVSE